MIIMKNLGKREKIMVSISLTIVGSYLIYSFLYDPLLKTIKEAEEQHEIVTQEISDLVKKINLPGSPAARKQAIEIIKLDYFKDEKELLKKEVILPEEDQISETMAKITDLADQSKVELIFSKRQTMVTDQAYKKLPIEMVLSCAHHNLVKFLDGLNNMDWLILVDDIDLKIDSGNLPNLNVRLTLNIYVK